MRFNGQVFGCHLQEREMMSVSIIELINVAF